ncbi:MAG: DUF4142 domain-containing protein [Cytophagales bacterium]|nr:MAG: DUF4142 domain-containing protein [Cytophagales bacterium]
MKSSQKLTLGLGVLATLALANSAMAQQNTRMNSGATTSSSSMMNANMVGRQSKAEFDRVNKKGAADVAAIRPTSTKLSTADQNLMLEVAKGGMMQLETSRIAVQKATSPEVRAIAQAEVDEQTGLSAKLKEIAQAKGVTLPESPDADTQAMITRMNAMSAKELEQHYMGEHAVKGHEKLDQVMNKVKSQASDANLKSIEMVAHPLVKAHLNVSQDVLSKMGNGGTMNR